MKNHQEPKFTQPDISVFTFSVTSSKMPDVIESMQELLERQQALCFDYEDSTINSMLRYAREIRDKRTSYVQQYSTLMNELRVHVAKVCEETGRPPTGSQRSSQGMNDASRLAVAAPSGQGQGMPPMTRITAPQMPPMTRVTGPSPDNSSSCEPSSQGSPADRRGQSSPIDPTSAQRIQFNENSVSQVLDGSGRTTPEVCNPSASIQSQGAACAVNNATTVSSGAGATSSSGPTDQTFTFSGPPPCCVMCPCCGYSFVGKFVPIGPCTTAMGTGSTYQTGTGSTATGGSTLAGVNMRLCNASGSTNTGTGGTCTNTSGGVTCSNTTGSTIAQANLILDGSGSTGTGACTNTTGSTLAGVQYRFDQSGSSGTNSGCPCLSNSTGATGTGTCSNTTGSTIAQANMILDGSGSTGTGTCTNTTGSTIAGINMRLSNASGSTGTGGTCTNTSRTGGTCSNTTGSTIAQANMILNGSGSTGTCTNTTGSTLGGVRYLINQSGSTAGTNNSCCTRDTSSCGAPTSSGGTGTCNNTSSGSTGATTCNDTSGSTVAEVRYNVDSANTTNASLGNISNRACPSSAGASYYERQYFETPPGMRYDASINSSANCRRYLDASANGARNCTETSGGSTIAETNFRCDGAGSTGTGARTCADTTGSTLAGVRQMFDQSQCISSGGPGTCNNSFGSGAPTTAIRYLFDPTMTNDCCARYASHC